MKKIHFGITTDFGDYEYPCPVCESTLCGVTTEQACCERTTENWKLVTCKKCLRSKDKYLLKMEEEDRFMAQDMGNFAEFVNSEEKKGVNK